MALTGFFSTGVRASAPFRRPSFQCLLIGLMLLSALLSPPLWAYSYITIDNEPVIKARESMVAAMQNRDIPAMQQALAMLDDELAFFREFRQVDLRPEFERSIQATDLPRLQHLLDRVLYQTIAVNLSMVDLTQYQFSRVLLLKTKVFAELLAPALNEAQRLAVQQATYGLLDSAGSPGVFGAGAKPFSQAAFDEHQGKLLQALKQFEH